MHCLALVFALAAAPEPAATRDVAFWQSIAGANYAVPPGESAGALLLELGALLGSPDPKLRDGFGYEIAAAWIHRDRVVPAEDLRLVLAAWTANLGRGVGGTGDDSVLLRSFSALDLSLIAAADLKQPFLRPEEHVFLLNAALEYLAREKDLRAYDTAKGWIHATAHTADLLKFLARSHKLPADGAQRVLDAVEAKLNAADTAFTHGEDERLAAALLSLLLREDARAERLNPWLARLREAGRALWTTPPLVDPAAYARVQNQKNTLKSLHLLLARRASAAALPPAAAAAQAAILDALAAP